MIQGKKYRWRIPHIDQLYAIHLASHFNLSVPVISTLLHRGFETEDAIERFIYSDRDRDVNHPSLMKDADKAVDRLITALERNEKILIAGDYDVDGITSSSLILLCLLPLGAQINFFLPHRVRDGYGLSVKTVERAAKNDYKLIVTVDNGITAFDAGEEAERRGIDLIITDHHRPHAHVPKAYAIINPHQEDCAYPFKGFAGVGVSFKLMSLLYERLNLPLPHKVYELMLLGTVADVVPLVDENRHWVRHGLSVVNKQESISLHVLKTNARFTKQRLSSQDIGFFITPQINALGRLDDAREGVKFLIGTDREETHRIGQTLASLNDARRAIERSIIADIETSIAAKKIDVEHDALIVGSSTEWPPGVIGLVASRFVSQYHKPTFLFHITSEGVAKGSCRSIPALNIFHLLTDVKDMLISFGGHAAAAGLALPAQRLEELKERLHALILERLTPDDFLPTLHLDAELTLRETTSRLLHDLSYLEPFGCENSSPLFFVKDVTVIGKPVILKDIHLKLNVFSDGIIKPVIFFNRPDLVEDAARFSGETCNLAVHVLENHWNNEVRVELQGIDIAFGG